MKAHSYSAIAVYPSSSAGGVGGRGGAGGGAGGATCCIERSDLHKFAFVYINPLPRLGVGVEVAAVEGELPPQLEHPIPQRVQHN